LLAFLGLHPPLTLTHIFPSTIKLIPRNILVSVTFGTSVSAVRRRWRSASLAAMITKGSAFILILMQANKQLPALRAQWNE